jgi:hypothetical protein
MEKFTVGELKQLLSKYSDDTLISIEDMNGNAFYTNSIAERLDGDTPSIELLLPVYISELSIEPNYENVVYTSDCRVVE